MTTTSRTSGATTTATSYVFRFGDGHADGSADMKDLLGGKGAGLAEMTNIGIPVPPGFTITTEVCTAFYDNNRNYPPGLEDEVRGGMAFVEQLLGRRFGDPERPLLVSVRSGARVSMPGMMDTVLNLGLNDAVAEGLAQESGDKRFAYDSYRPFVAMYGDLGDDCATGVAFTRDPATGESRFFGEYLPNAQGEDVVAGIRTPQPVSSSRPGDNSLEATMPHVFAQLTDVYQKLERHYRDMQDIEFTIQQGKLWLLQTRSGKRTGRAMVKIAV